LDFRAAEQAVTCWRMWRQRRREHRRGGDAENASATGFADAAVWQRGLYPAVTCPHVLTIAEWHVCWPPVQRDEQKDPTSAWPCEACERACWRSTHTTGAIADGVCIVYAFGVAGADPFTSSMAGRGCAVHAFDPGANHPTNWMPNVTFHHWGLLTGAASLQAERRFSGALYGSTAGGEYLSLGEIMRRVRTMT
jgi:hypothetical protein